MSDPLFLAECGIEADMAWLMIQNATTPEQMRYVEDLLRLSRLLGGDFRTIYRREAKSE